MFHRSHLALVLIKVTLVVASLFLLVNLLSVISQPVVNSYCDIVIVLVITVIITCAVPHYHCYHVL